MIKRGIESREKRILDKNIKEECIRTKRHTSNI